MHEEARETVLTAVLASISTCLQVGQILKSQLGITGEESFHVITQTRSNHSKES